MNLRSNERDQGFKVVRLDSHEAVQRPLDWTGLGVPHEDILDLRATDWGRGLEMQVTADPQLHHGTLPY